MTFENFTVRRPSYYASDRTRLTSATGAAFMRAKAQATSSVDGHLFGVSIIESNPRDVPTNGTVRALERAAEDWMRATGGIDPGSKPGVDPGPRER